MADDDYGDPSDPQHPQFFDWIMIQLEDAASAAAFCQTVATAIRHAHRLDREELTEIADVVGIPWKRKRGRPKNRALMSRIFFKYIFEHGKMALKVSRADAIKLIVDDFARTGETITFEKAGYLYDEARKGGWMRQRRKDGQTP